jgi:outer membrane protein
MKRIICLLLLTVAPLQADTLTINQAVELGLKNNFSIRLARVGNDRNYCNRKLKKGVLLPTLRLDGSAATTGSSVALTPGGNTESNEVRTTATLNWTLFDGFKMFYTGRKIDEQITLNELATRHEIESAVAEIMTAYYMLTAQRSLLDAARKQLTFSKAHLDFTNAQFEYGRVGRREVLNQMVLINADSSQVLARRLDVTQALHTLNIALGRTPDMSVQPQRDTLVVLPEKDARFWYYEALEHNTGLKMAVIRRNISRTSFAISRAALWPTLAVNSSVATVFTEPTDYVRLRGEATLSIPLFSGFSKITATENAALDTVAATLTVEQQRLELQSIIYRQWEQFENSYHSVLFEREAIVRARQSLDLSEEQFRLGRISALQLREAQLALINAQVRYETALFQNKAVALQLKQLAGRIVMGEENEE